MSIHLRYNRQEGLGECVQQLTFCEGRVRGDSVARVLSVTGSNEQVRACDGSRSRSEEW